MWYSTPQTTGIRPRPGMDLNLGECLELEARQVRVRTSSSVEPTAQRSPTSAPLTSTPRTVRLSPKAPGPSEEGSAPSHHSVSSPAYA
jgi:hypothetical protein